MGRGQHCKPCDPVGVAGAAHCGVAGAAPRGSPWAAASRAGTCPSSRSPPTCSALPPTIHPTVNHVPATTTCLIPTPPPAELHEENVTGSRNATASDRNATIRARTGRTPAQQRAAVPMPRRRGAIWHAAAGPYGTPQGGRRTVVPVEDLHRRLRVGIVRGLEADLVQPQLFKERLPELVSTHSRGPLNPAGGAGASPGSCPSGRPAPGSCPPPGPQSATATAHRRVSLRLHTPTHPHSQRPPDGLLHCSCSDPGPGNPEAV